MIVVSDSHLSDRTPEATAHWDAVVDHVAAAGPDLVVHAGDISTDGETSPTTWTTPGASSTGCRAARGVARQPRRRRHAGLDVRRRGRGRGRDARAYRAVFGPDRFSVAVGRWRLIGIDAQLLGAGEPRRTTSGPGSRTRSAGCRPRRPSASCSTSRWCPRTATATGPGATCPSRPVGACSPPLATVDARLVVSGHVHQALRRDRAGLAQVWVPTSWAAVPDRVQPPMGDKRAGVTGLTLHDDGSFAVDDTACRASTTSSSASTSPRPTARSRRSTEPEEAPRSVAVEDRRSGRFRPRGGGGRGGPPRRLLDRQHDEELGHRQTRRWWRRPRCRGDS